MRRLTGVSRSDVARPVLRLAVMKRLKKVELKKLSVDVTTIRVLSDAEQKQVAGGISATCSDVECPGWGSRTCSVRTPGC